MADEGLPTSVKAFIDEYIVSVEQLEILLLLAKNPGNEYTVQTAYDVILSTKSSVESWLERFADLQLAERLPSEPKAFRYNPGDQQRRATVADLEQAYKAMPVRVIEAIYKRPPAGQGADPAKGFADAFRLRKD